MAYKNKEDNRKAQVAWKAKNPERYKEIARRRQIKYKYGITEEEYDEFMSTSVVCEVCETTEDLVYDHCHTTMKFRGVLCRSCNRHIGGLGDNLEALLKVVNYLKKES